ncbi:hypothetical protein C1632_02885 [Microbacterium testaceum]|uniref:hypothetical protein n=1 Tax=Microbacterium testaceum TaxID=2033 RepID=UPI000CCF070D|nr:hypothetical protein [Microbacterium testaceum]PNW10717.1 hypothetical protein C1632_02885 [Microbacterium testaceum]
MPSIDDDDELAALRRRAYAPGADISSDPAALRRLIELESRSSDDVAPAPSEVEEEPVDPGDVDEPVDPPRRRFRMPRLRRSTTILLTAAVLVIACAATALVVVQRVQTDPLQVGATQIARLAPDPDFSPPSSFTQGLSSGVTSYAQFEGFRVAVYASFDTGEGASKCMTVWQPALLQELGNGTSYNGRYMIPSCGAGVFPPSATMLLSDGTPELRNTDLPAGTALQFVYDAANDEVVVFEG